MEETLKKEKTKKISKQTKKEEKSIFKKSNVKNIVKIY